MEAFCERGSEMKIKAIVMDEQEKWSLRSGE